MAEDAVDAYIEERDGQLYCFFTCQQANDPDSKCRVPVYRKGEPKPEKYQHAWEWQNPDEPLRPTLMPSINCRNNECWHGYITQGVIGQHTVTPKHKRPKS